MKRLKNKVFYTIILILTSSLISFIIIFNLENYKKEKDSIENGLNMAIETGRKDDNPTNKLDDKEIKDIPSINDIRYMDFVVYTVLLNDDNSIKDIINHSNNYKDDNEITIIANKILSSNKLDESYIGNLYLNNYAYKYVEGDCLIILDIDNNKKVLISYLEISVIIFLILEILIIYITKKITDWIILPVKESFNKQKRFIADASHELKTPLSVIIASSDLLEDNPKEKKWLKNIRNEADRMNYLISNLLELAATEKDDKLLLKEGNLSKTIELAVLTFEARAYENKIKLKYDIEDNIIFKYDENNIKQLVEILLDNAIKHSDKGKVINLSLKNDNNNIILLVKNKGDGIPIGEEEKIFERFYRVDKSRNRDDNRYGLGLSIAKNIVNNHNGKITAKSEDNETIFTVILKK